MLRVQSTDASTLASVSTESRRTSDARAGNGEAAASAPAAGTLAAAAATRPTSEQIKQAVNAVNEVIRTRNPEIQFEIDEDSAEVVTRIVDKTTGEVIRQIPSEEMLRLAHAMHQKLDSNGTVQLVRASA